MATRKTIDSSAVEGMDANEDGHISKEEMDMKRDMIKQAQENSNTYAKANPVKIEPTFNPGFSTTQGFNGTSAPSTNIIYINGKPAPQQAPHPEI